jgi:hypothetical protein
MEPYRQRGNCTVFHYSRCAVETAIVGVYKAIASGLVEQKERVPLEAWNVAEERSKTSMLSKEPAAVQIVGVPFIDMLAW